MFTSVSFFSKSRTNTNLEPRRLAVKNYNDKVTIEVTVQTCGSNFIEIGIGVEAIVHGISTPTDCIISNREIPSVENNAIYWYIL